MTSVRYSAFTPLSSNVKHAPPLLSETKVKVTVELSIHLIEYWVGE